MALVKAAANPHLLVEVGATTMRRFAIIVSPILALAACSQTPAPATTSTSTAATSGSDTADAPAPGSKFSMIHLGMDKAEVKSVIGPATDESVHETGKAYIPFYFGSDTDEINAHYKGEGVLIYESQAVGSNQYLLKAIDVNSAETGYGQ